MQESELELYPLVDADLGGGPSTAQNFLSFMKFFGNFGKIVCWRPRWAVGVPSYGNSESAPEYDRIERKKKDTVGKKKDTVGERPCCTTKLINMHALAPTWPPSGHLPQAFKRAHP